MNIADLVAAFLHHCQRSGCRPATLRQYRSRLNPLSAEVGAATWPARKRRRRSDLTREQLLDWIHAHTHWPPGHKSAGEPKAAATIRSYLICIQLVQTYVREFHHGRPLLREKDLKKPTGARRERIPTPEDVSRILGAAPADWSRMYRALRLTGARPSELTGATVADLEIPTGQTLRSALESGLSTLVLKVHKTMRKTGKPRRIPLGKAVSLLVLESLGDRTSGPLFTDAAGRPWTVPRLSRTFRQLRQKLGLPSDLVLYSTRHEFGTAVARNVGILQAKELLGHADIQTTQRYTHLQESELRKVQEDAIADILPITPPPAEPDSEPDQAAA